jgi:2-(1,2-epoxy-1,2-dihydrophenyl)acetyl-CoA isomerase
MVAVIRLNRPKVMNSMNAQTRSEFADAQARAESDDNVRVVILTGVGRAFSSGTDVKEASEAPAFDISITQYKPLIDAVTQSDKIYLAAINGFAGGVALGLAMGADLAVMAETAVMFSPFANIGLVPDGGSSWFLLHSLGHKRAFAAIAECTQFDAQTCLQMGMVNKVVPDAELFDAAMQWAQELSQRAPLSLRYAKKILHAAGSMSQQDTARLESEYQNKCITSVDAANAMRAFLNKEKPIFIGK